MDRRKSLIPLCRHTKTDGLLCGSPALTGRAFCYHHQRYHHTRKPGGRPPNPRPLNNQADVRREIAHIFSGLLTGHLRPSQASRMLYLLQLASTCLKFQPNQMNILPPNPAASCASPKNPAVNP